MPIATLNFWVKESLYNQFVARKTELRAKIKALINQELREQ